MLWLLKSIILGELILGGVFALILFLSWLQGFLNVHFQKEKDR